MRHTQAADCFYYRGRVIQRRCFDGSNGSVDGGIGVTEIEGLRDHFVHQVGHIPVSHNPVCLRKNGGVFTP